MKINLMKIIKIVLIIMKMNNLMKVIKIIILIKIILKTMTITVGEIIFPRKIAFFKQIFFNNN